MADTQAHDNPRDEQGRPVGRDEVIEATFEAAADLFATRNPSQVTVREIAARAGVSHALVHRYLGTKDDILRAVLERDRQETALFWMHDHGMTRTAGTFSAELPPGRYLRTVIRAALDGVKIDSADLKFPHADRMLELLETSPNMPRFANESGFDPRLLFSAITAMAAGMAVAEDFFLAQSGLQGEDRGNVHAELNRLMAHIMTLSSHREA